MRHDWEALAGDPRLAAGAALEVIASDPGRLWDQGAYFRHPAERTVLSWSSSDRAHPAAGWLAAAGDGSVKGHMACAGGWAAILSSPPGTLVGAGSLLLPGGERLIAHVHAIGVLNLTDEEAGYLLNDKRALAEVTEALAAIRDGRQAGDTAGFIAWEARRREREATEGYDD
jgi:hypothetical protein